LSQARSPYVGSWEFPNNEHPAETASASERAQALAHIWRERLKGVNEIMDKFQALTIESEAVWGGDIKNRLTVLSNLVSDIQVKSMDLIMAQSESPLEIEQVESRVEPIIFGSRDDPENAMSVKIKDAIADIQSYTDKHLN
jgi:hypothetical protein